MKKIRTNYTAEEKVAILRRHLLEQTPISKLCDELGLQPTVFYRWQKEFFENGAAAFQAKDEVLAELMTEHIALKKKLWGTFTEVWVPPEVRGILPSGCGRYANGSRRNCKK